MAFRWLMPIALALIALSNAAAHVEINSSGFEDEVHSNSNAPHFGPEAPYYVAPSRNFDTVHTRLDLDVDLAGQYISGSVAHTIRPLRPSINRIELNCVDMQVSNVSLQDAGGGITYGVEWSQFEALDEHDNLLIVEIEPAAEYGKELILKVEYQGHPTYGLFFVAEEPGPGYRRLEAWSQGEGENNRHWIPSFDYPNDKATFEGKFRVAKGQYALSNGILVGQTDLGDKTEYHWLLDTPQVNYLIALAAGEYEIHRDDWRGMELMYLVPPGTGAETVERCYGKTPEMLSFFTDTIGIDYPFKKYAQVVVQDFIVGGMENTTCSFMNERSLFDEGTKLTRDADSLIAHEMVHMWWGDMVTMREWNDMWLNEGFATYFEKLWLANDYGDEAFRLAMLSTHEEVVGRDDREALPMVVDFFNSEGGRSNANVYIKGSSVLHMLRHQLGDEMFFEVIRNYGNKCKYGFAETADLMESVKEVTGENLDWFFEQWVFMAGHPKLSVSKKYDPSKGVLTMTVKQAQVVDGLVPIFRLPVEVEITTASGVDLFSVELDKAEQEFHFPVGDEPQMVIFDKGDWTLKTLDFNKSKTEFLYQLENGDQVSKVRAIRGLSSYRNDSDVAAALGSIINGNDDVQTRQEAIGIYRSFPVSNTVELLLGALNSSEARVRLTAAERARHAKGNEPVEGLLLELFDTDPSPFVRSACLDSLVNMRAKCAKETCVRALGIASNRETIRNSAINGLSALNATDQLDAIKQLCTAGNSRWYRDTALRVYTHLTKQLDDIDASEAAAEFLLAQLDDNWLRTRHSTISFIDGLGDKSAIEPLREFALTEEVSYIADFAERTADNLESMTTEEQSIDELEADIRSLERQLEELKRRISESEKKAAAK